MSTRVQNDGGLGQAQLQTGRTEGKSPVAKGQSHAASAYAPSGVDSVQISSLSEKIAAAGSSGETERASRVRQLSALYASGQYHVDSRKVSQSIVEAALGTAAPEKAS